MLQADDTIYMKPQRFEQIVFAESEIREVKLEKNRKRIVCYFKEFELNPGSYENSIIDT